MAGRSLKIFLVDGTPSGVRTAEIGLSTIKALVVPRASLSAVTSRSEIQKTGVYVLVGADPDAPGQRMAYVGEADTVISRLSAHNRDTSKDFWEECVLFVSKDENLTKAHVRYVEARLITLAREARRANITNGTTPPDAGKLPEPDEVEMNEFISQALLLLGALGYDLFEPNSPPPVAATPVGGVRPPPPSLEFIGDRFNATATLDMDAGQITVRSGSLARRAETPSLQLTYKNLRKQLIDNGVLAEHDADSYAFSQDFGFSAASAAAQVVSGSTVNGRTAWRIAGTSQTLAEWQDAQLPAGDS